MLSALQTVLGEISYLLSSTVLNYLQVFHFNFQLVLNRESRMTFSVSWLNIPISTTLIIKVLISPLHPQWGTLKGLDFLPFVLQIKFALQTSDVLAISKCCNSTCWMPSGTQQFVAVKVGYQKCALFYIWLNYECSCFHSTICDQYVVCFT